MCKEKVKENAVYPEGIYFGMPEDEYHKIPYFSRSACEEMIFDPSGEEYWYNSPMNPNRPEQVETEAMRLGTAIHTKLLEPEKFDELYIKEPSENDFPDKVILKGVEDLKAFLKSVGEKVSGNKPDLIQRVMPYLDPKCHMVWDVYIAGFKERAKDMRVITADTFEILKGIEESLSLRPNMPELFKNSISEITIIWKENGILCKCRLDGARPEAIIEVKSFAVKHKKKPLEKAMTDTFNYDRYNLQSFVYLQALSTAIKNVNAGKAKVYGDVDKEWLKEFLKTPNKQFFTLFFRTQAPFQCKSFELRKVESSGAAGATSNVYYTQAKSLWDSGLFYFKDCCEKWGVKRWVNMHDVDELTDLHIPQIMYQV